MEEFIPTASREIHAALPENIRGHIDSINDPAHSYDAPADRGHLVVDRLHEEGLAHSHRALLGLFNQHPGFLVRHPDSGRLGWHVGPGIDGPAEYGPHGRAAAIYPHSSNDGTVMVTLHPTLGYARAGMPDESALPRVAVNESAALHGHPARTYDLQPEQARALVNHFLWHGFRDDAHERLARPRDTQHDVEPRLTEMKKIKPQTPPKRSVAKVVADLAGVKPSRAQNKIAKLTGGKVQPLVAGELPPPNARAEAGETYQHPWLRGTRVGHHLLELAEHEHDAVADAARAVLTQSDPKAAARLGQLLEGSGHRLADAYNWGTMQRNLEGDQRLRVYLTEAGLSRGITAETFARNIERLGQRHSALDALAAIHGTNRDEVLRAASRIVDRYADKREVAAQLVDSPYRTRPDDYLSWESNDEHARLSKLGTLAHGVAAGVAAAVGHGIGAATGLENAELPGAALGFYAGLGRLGSAARAGVDALMAHVAKRRAARGGKLSPRIEALIAQVQEKQPLPDHGPTPARSRVSFIRALREHGLDPRLSHDPDLLRVWHLNAGHLGIDGEGALNAAARGTGISHMRAHGYLPLPPDKPASTVPARIMATQVPGKPPAEYRRYGAHPTPTDLFSGIDAGPPPPAKTKPSAPRKKKVKRPPGPSLFDQV